MAIMTLKPETSPCIDVDLSIDDDLDDTTDDTVSDNIQDEKRMTIKTETPPTPGVDVVRDNVQDPMKMLLDEENNFKRFKDRGTAVDCIKLHSTLQGKRVQVDREKSSGQRVTIICASNHGSTGTQHTPYECQYKVILDRARTKKKGKKAEYPWGIRSESYPIHCENCICKGKMSFREVKILTHDTSVCTIKESIKRIAAVNKIAQRSIPKSVAVRYRMECRYTGYKNYDVNWGKLDKWGQQFIDRNPGSKFDLEVDQEGRFKRMFIGIGSAVRIATKTGLEFSGIDGTFFKHVEYKGVILILVTRDGNNKILLVAWVICTTEKGENYNYMAEKLKEMDGMGEYLNQPRHLMYSDRHKGIPAFEKHFSCGKANCIVHIVDNVRENVIKQAGSLVSSDENYEPLTHHLRTTHEQ